MPGGTVQSTTYTTSQIVEYVTGLVPKVSWLVTLTEQR